AAVFLFAGQARQSEGWARGNMTTEVVLAEKYAFEAKRLVTDPKIEITPKQCRYVGSIWLRARTAQFRQELKQPGFDHWKSLTPQIATAHEREMTTGMSKSDLTPARETHRQMFARLEMTKAGARRAGRH